MHFIPSLFIPILMTINSCENKDTNAINQADFNGDSIADVYFATYRSSDLLVFGIKK